MSDQSTHSVPHKRKRGERIHRSPNRDYQRDKIMRKVFAEPGFAMVIAKRLGVSHQNVSQWNKVPAHHVIDIAPILDMTPEQIRPDVFKRRRK